VKVLLDDEAHLDDLHAAFRVEVDGQRLDVVVAAQLAVAVREVRRLAAEGRIRVAGRAVLGDFPRLARGAPVVVLGERARPALLGERIPLPILHEDDRALIVDKPAGLAMTPGDGHPAGTLANALRGLGRPLSSVEGPLRPGIVHRLDWGTSGALLVCKDDAIHGEIAREFLAHRAERRYLALVHGHPARDDFTVDAPLARRRAGRKSQAVREDGRPARTRFVVRERLPAGVAVIEAAPETGRTHQIRVHLAHAGHPLLGDTLYAGGDASRRRLWAALGLRRPALHAEWLSVLGRSARAPLPADLARALEVLAQGARHAFSIGP
jgi:23S rRNA pseudouridine1911/1915/1917 synthase